MSSICQETNYSFEQFNMDSIESANAPASEPFNVNPNAHTFIPSGCTQIGNTTLGTQKIPVPEGLQALLHSAHAISDYKEVLYRHDCKVFQEYKHARFVSPDTKMMRTDEHLLMRRKFLELRIHRILRPIPTFSELRIKNWVGFVETCTDAHDLLLSYADELTVEMQDIEHGYWLLFNQPIEIASMENLIFKLQEELSSTKKQLQDVIKANHLRPNRGWRQ